MQKLLISWLFVASLLAAGCSPVYKQDIQQGNVITQEMVNKLQPGMAKSQVRYILGTPLLVDVFHQERWDYLYSMQEGGKDRQQKRIAIYFENDKLSRIEGDLRPMPEESPVEKGKENVFAVPDYDD
jgi:outer membrane protein assembly factor BamE